MSQGNHHQPDPPANVAPMTREDLITYATDLHFELVGLLHGKIKYSLRMQLLAAALALREALPDSAYSGAIARDDF